MYERIETIECSSEEVVTFYNTLSSADALIFEEILQNEFISKALYFYNTRQNNKIISHSCWKNKELYQEALLKTNQLCIEMLNKSVDQYYENNPQFIKTVSENEF